jgi:DNA-binding ferritin-like protein
MDINPENNKDTFRARGAKIKELQKELYDFRFFYNQVMARINKLEDDTKAAIEFADLAEDDKAAEMILEFCEDITKLVGE